MSQPIELEITARGEVAMLHDDAVDLAEFGGLNVTRASHVEWEDGLWTVRSAKTGALLGSFPRRAAALSWEKTYYSPSGKGWKEIMGDE